MLLAPYDTRAQEVLFPKIPHGWQPCPDLQAMAETGRLGDIYTYERYWHGIRTIVAPAGRALRDPKRGDHSADCGIPGVGAGAGCSSLEKTPARGGCRRNAIRWRRTCVHRLCCTLLRHADLLLWNVSGVWGRRSYDLHVAGRCGADQSRDVDVADYDRVGHTLRRNDCVRRISHRPRSSGPHGAASHHSGRCAHPIIRRLGSALSLGSLRIYVRLHDPDRCQNRGAAPFWRGHRVFYSDAALSNGRGCLTGVGHSVRDPLRYRP